MISRLHIYIKISKRIYNVIFFYIKINYVLKFTIYVQSFTKIRTWYIFIPHFLFFVYFHTWNNHFLIFYSYLVSNSQFQDVVKNFSDLLYFKNEASSEKILFYTFELFFHVESFSLLSYVSPVMDTLRTKQKRTRSAKYEKHPFCSFVQFLTHENTERTQESRRNHVSSVFNSFMHWLMHFCFSTWYFFSSYAFDIITCKGCLFWK